VGEVIISAVLFLCSTKIISSENATCCSHEQSNALMTVGTQEQLLINICWLNSELQQFLVTNMFWSWF